MKDAPPPDTGHTLGSGGSAGSGGAGGVGGGQTLSPAEVRARRLAALSGGGGAGYASPAAAAASAFTSPGAGPGPGEAAASREGSQGNLKDPPPRHVSFGGTAAPDDKGSVHNGIGTDDGGGATAMDIDTQSDTEDAELQRALALSLMGGDDAAATAGGGGDMKRSVAGRPPTPSPADDRKPAAISTSNIATIDHDSKPPAAVSASASRVVAPSSSTSDEAQEAPPPKMENVAIQTDTRCGVPQSHLAAFHSIMWNDSVTTEGDRERWRGQGIDTTPSIWDYDEAEASTTTVDSSSIGSLTASTAASSTTSAEAAVPSLLEDKNVGDTIASALGSHHSLWGLTQVHGGPCGVLAAVQAEMLRMILFGRAGKGSGDSSRSTTSDGHCNGLPSVQYPRTATDGMADVAPTRTEVQESLALAVGTILARASLVPLASVKEREAEEESKKEGWVKVAKKTNGEEEKDGDSAETEEQCRGVRIVLPAEAILGSDEGPDAMDDDQAPGGTSSHIYDGLTWEMLDSSSGGDALCVCSINITPETAEEEEEEGTGPESKRQRKNSVAGSTIVSCEATLDGHISCLATITAKFLLDKNNSAEKDPLLQYFAGKGGVLLLVLSLLESRGVDRTKRDMDDSSSTLTSQFGHSSQELINLLLTGQAVSNVFDNSMELGGDVVCRGVQSQPAVGYLSQLEAMRYCEVGGYYKSPLFPVWVVGSTSHFTVLIGDARCMVETSSDALLEKCRRAFRAVDGGEDNGFIQVSSLGEVVRKLDLFETIGSDGLQTLQASLEVHGAGIILWSDFWKVASRLLTGATLESVLQGDNDSPGTKDKPLLLTQFGEGAAASSSSAATSAAAASSSASGAASAGGDYMLSDEELARKLAAEWGTDTGQASSSAAAAPSAPSKAKSDEELARELQAQWNADPDMPPLEHVPNIVGDDIIAEAKPGEYPKPRSGEVNQAAEITREEAKMEPVATGPEDVGNTFYLYHYNGLRGGTFTSFRVIRPKATDAVGSSITVSSHGYSSGGDLEDVVRTKWQQCQFNWLGKQPPYID